MGVVVVVVVVRCFLDTFLGWRGGGGVVVWVLWVFFVASLLRLGCVFGVSWRLRRGYWELARRQHAKNGFAQLCKTSVKQ